MAYRIEYGTAVPERYQKAYKPFRLQVLTAAWLLVFALLVRQFFPTGVEALRTFLLPGPQSTTQIALEAFVTDMRNGEAVSDALFAFCEQIIASDPTIAG